MQSGWPHISGDKSMKVNTKGFWLCFIIANIIWLTIASFAIVPDRIFVLQGQSATLTLMERHLAILEENFQRYEEHTALLSDFQIEGAIFIQPPGHTASLLTDVRDMLYAHALDELEFYAGERASHYIGGRHVAETRATVLANGYFNNISAFLHSLYDDHRYLHLERIQIAEAFSLTQLRLTFSIYEEW